jgi:hypothetical protein
MSSSATVAPRAGETISQRGSCFEASVSDLWWRSGPFTALSRLCISFFIKKTREFLDVIPGDDMHKSNKEYWMAKERATDG